MTDAKSVGKDLGKTKKEADRNVGRAKPNFPYSQRAVDDTDPYNIYQKDFNLGEGTTASLDIHIKEREAPCTVNPPEINCAWSGQWGGTYSVSPDCGGFNEMGVLTNWHFIKEDTNTGEYLVAGGKVIIPYDGCYLVEARGGGWGGSYFEADGYTSLEVYKHSSSGTISLGSAYLTTTGFIWTLGPQVWYTPSASRLIKMIEAKAGDSISVRATAGGFCRCYPWFGTHLRGIGVFDGHTTSLAITLIALAEDVVLTNKDGSPGTSPKPPTPPTPPTPPDTSEQTKQCILSNNNILILNDLVTFYNHLTSKGERPYPNLGWTTEENWSNFWTDYWSRLGWQSNTGEYPFPAPQTISELLAYQTAESQSLENCPAIDSPYNSCDMFLNIGNQLQLLKNFYYSDVVFPLYIDISGTTEPTFFDTWPDFWAWVWDRGYNMAIHAYDMEYVWTEARHNFTNEITPWPPATTIGEINAYISLYTSNLTSNGCK
jgi:hypothetical protein